MFLGLQYGELQKDYLHADGKAHIKHTLSFDVREFYPALTRAKLREDYLSLMAKSVHTKAERVPIQCQDGAEHYIWRMILEARCKARSAGTLLTK